MKILLFVILFFNVFAASANFMVYPISKDIQSGGSETIKVFS
ncbi:fimbrial protein, partial [Escherichia coli]|nr:fimbrial protein [Escherichia coli]